VRQDVAAGAGELAAGVTVLHFTRARAVLAASFHLARVLPSS